MYRPHQSWNVGELESLQGGLYERVDYMRKKFANLEKNASIHEGILYMRF